MTNVVRVKDAAVTIGVVDRNLAVADDLREVTYTDVFGTPHTVYAHRDGPYSSGDDIVSAHRAGTLHPFKDHDTAVAYARDRGDHVTADRITEAQAADNPAGDTKGDDE